MILRLKDLTVVEQLVLAFSLVAVGILLIDPFLLEQARALPPGARDFFRSVTHIGRSNWILIPTGCAIALAIVLRRRRWLFERTPDGGYRIRGSRPTA